jgi:hypothetical protein
MIPKEIAFRISPNYSLDVESVYLDFSQALAESPGDLNNLFRLCLPYQSQEVSSLPSWTIDHGLIYLGSKAPSLTHP